MIPTKQMAELLMEMITTEPLGDGEIRRVVGMGETYLALDSTKVGADYATMATLTIDGTLCQLLRRLTDTSP